MNVVQLRQEIAKIPEDAPSKPLWMGVVEELERLQTPPGPSSASVVVAQDLHSPGLCYTPACAQGCATLRQEEWDKAKGYVTESISMAARWAGPEAVDAYQILVAATEDWVKAGKPEAGMKETPRAMALELRA